MALADPYVDPDASNPDASTFSSNADFDARLGIEREIVVNSGRVSSNAMSRTLTVSGMSCTGCEEAVTDALTAIDGVESASADHEAGTATIEGDAGDDELIEAVKDAGYEASA